MDCILFLKSGKAFRNKTITLLVQITPVKPIFAPSIQHYEQINELRTW